MKRFVSGQSKNEAFTLIELMVVIAIIAILASLFTSGAFLGQTPSSNWTERTATVLRTGRVSDRCEFLSFLWSQFVPRRLTGPLLKDSFLAFRQYLLCEWNCDRVPKWRFRAPQRRAGIPPGQAEQIEPEIVKYGCPQT